MKPFSGISFAKALMALWIGALLTSCSLAPKQASAENKPLRVGFTSRWGDYTIIVAQKKGLFEKYGVKVEPVFYKTFDIAPPDLAARRIDAGLFSIDNVITVANHTDLKIVAVSDNGSPHAIVSIPEISQVTDLLGKRIGVQVGTNDELLIAEMLATVEIKISDVSLVNMDAKEVPPSLGRTIDAGLVAEPYTAEAISKGNNLLLKSAEFAGLHPNVIVFNNAVILERSDDVQAFLKAWFEAVEYRTQNPDDANQTIAAYFNTSINALMPNDLPEILTLKDNHDLFQPTSTSRRTLYQTTRLNADFLIRLGALSAPLDIEALLSPAYLP